MRFHWGGPGLFPSVGSRTKTHPLARQNVSTDRPQKPIDYGDHFPYPLIQLVRAPKSCPFDKPKEQDLGLIESVTFPSFSRAPFWRARTVKDSCSLWVLVPNSGAPASCGDFS